MDKIDEILLDWFEYNQSYEPALSYGRADPACRDFRISRQWMDFDDLNAEVEWNIKSGIGKIVDPIVQKLETRYRIAINNSMRNFQLGYSVWSGDVGDYEKAKEILCPQFVSAGLIEKSACIPRNFALISDSVASSHA